MHGKWNQDLAAYGADTKCQRCDEEGRSAGAASHADQAKYGAGRGDQNELAVFHQIGNADQKEQAYAITDLGRGDNQAGKARRQLQARSNRPHN
ncbi:hypothetical protein GCM10022405_20220 [Gibbsiella dentisursi]|uniref:Uncharacterized protein n=1 Tax=Gibbsiella dentisursi TaxID=796890 RepID=A0ABP7L655_9GAMM